MKSILIIICLIFLASCKENQKANWCEKGINRAKEEIDNQGLVYVKYLTLAGGSDRYDEELENLLSEYGIKFRYEPLSSIEIKGEDEKRKCYSKSILEALEEKYGKDFIKKLANQADEKFARKENYIYEDFNLDEKPYFINPKGKEYSGEELVKYLNRYLEYPKDYEMAKTVEERPFVQLEFIVNRDGRPKDFKFVESHFPKEKEKFREYFEKEVLKIISKIEKWEAGTIHGKNVDSKFSRKIPLDWII